MLVYVMSKLKASVKRSGNHRKNSALQLLQKMRSMYVSQITIQNKNMNEQPLTKEWLVETHARIGELQQRYSRGELSRYFNRETYEAFGLVCEVIERITPRNT